MNDSQDFVVISQVRTASTRLPGKVMKKVAGREMLLHFIDRVLMSERVKELIIATTVEENDDIIVDLVKDYHPRCTVFRGSEFNVLDRTFRAAQHYRDRAGNEPVILRITSDCPLIDPRVIDQHIAEWEKTQADYLCSYIENRTWPHGMDVGIFTYDILKKAWMFTDYPEGREHVVPWMETNQKVKKVEFRAEKDLSKYRLTVDYPEDFILVQEILEHFLPEKPDYSMYEIIELLESRPELFEINRKHNQQAK